EGGVAVTKTDEVAVEEPLEIQLCATRPEGAAARSVSITMRTPGNDDELALGFLYSEGIITTATRIASVTRCGRPDPVSGEQNVVRVELGPDEPVDFERLERHFYTTSSCGVCGKASLDALRVAGAQPLGHVATRFPRDVIVSLPDRLRE